MSTGQVREDLPISPRAHNFIPTRHNFLPIFSIDCRSCPRAPRRMPGHAVVSIQLSAASCLCPVVSSHLSFLHLSAAIQSFHSLGICLFSICQQPYKVSFVGIFCKSTAAAIQSVHSLGICASQPQQPYKVFHSLGIFASQPQQPYKVIICWGVLFRD